MSKSKNTFMFVCTHQENTVLCFSDINFWSGPKTVQTKLPVKQKFISSSEMEGKHIKT